MLLFIGHLTADRWLFVEHMVPSEFPQHCSDCQGIKALTERAFLILTEHWSHCDHEGSAPWSRPSLHSKKADSCVFPRPWVHGVKFLLVGLNCVRAVWPYDACVAIDDGPRGVYQDVKGYLAFRATVQADCEDVRSQWVNYASIVKSYLPTRGSNLTSPLCNIFRRSV